MEEQMMDQKKETTKKEPKLATVASPKKKLSLTKNLSTEGAKLLSSLRDKANQKEFGRKIKDTEILDLALKLVKPEHLKPLQEASLSEEERFEQALSQHRKSHGNISREAFLGKLLRGEIAVSSSKDISS